MLNHHLIRRTLTGGLAIATVGLPTSAQAKLIESGGGPSPPSVSTTVALPVDSYSSRALGATATPASARPHGVDGGGSSVQAQTTASTSTGVPPVLPRAKASQLAKIEQAEPQTAASRAAKGRYSNAELNVYSAAATPHIIAGVPGVATPQSGFDWGDAGIGAAAGFALAILGLGAAVVISQRRPRRSLHNNALQS
jgi:hypothetical protein